MKVHPAILDYGMRKDGAKLMRALWGCERAKRAGNEDSNRIQMLRQTIPLDWAQFC